MANYDEISKLVRQFYSDAASDPNKDPISVASGTASSDCGINQTINNISNMQVRKSMNGSVRGYSMIYGFPNPTSSDDTNTYAFDSTSYVPFGEAHGGGGYTLGGGAGRQDRGGGVTNRGNNFVSVPASQPISGSADVNPLHAGLNDLAAGAQNAVNAIQTVFGPSWIGAASLAKWGVNTASKFMTGDVLGAGADVWNKFMELEKAAHPEDYGNIFSEDEYGRPVLDGMVVLNDDGSITMYLPDDAMAFLYRGLRDRDLFPTGDPYEAYTPPSGLTLGSNISIPVTAGGSVSSIYFGNEVLSISGNCTFATIWYGGAGIRVVMASSTQNAAYSGFGIERWNGARYTISGTCSSAYTYNNLTVYYAAFQRDPGYQEGGLTPHYCNKSPSLVGTDPINALAWTIIYGDAAVDPDATPGLSIDNDSTFFDPTIITGTNIPTIIQQMNDNYSNEMGNGITANIMDDSCNNITINYHPVSFPITVGVGDIFPIGGGNSIFGGGVNINFNPQSNPSISPDFQLNPNLYNFDIHDIIPSININPSIDGGSGIQLPELDWNNLLDHLFDVFSELIQGAPGGGGISLDPEINTTINNYYDSHDRTELPPININPPTIVNNNYITEGSGSGTSDLPTIINNVNIPPVTPIIIPPWPTQTEPSPTPADVEGWPASMWNVYNPTQAEVNAFGHWLWHPDFIDTIKRLFESPIDAVFTLHKVFVLPTTSGSAPIVVGTIASTVNAAVVSNQYTNLDCGEIELKEYFGNVFDYAPYTILQLYLPFIGIVELDPAYCMRSTISVFYTVDVFTGACVAKVSCKRDGYDVCVYEFTGSCSVEYPVSYHSYSTIVSGILSGAISAAAGALGTYISDNPMAAVYGGISGINQAMSGRSEIRHSGSLAGSPGAMGIRKPYLIISRPITELADNFPYFDGYPANQNVKVCQCSGYIRCKTTHFRIPNAYGNELEELDRLFKSGVIV